MTPINEVFPAVSASQKEEKKCECSYNILKVDVNVHYCQQGHLMSLEQTCDIS